MSRGRIKKLLLPSLVKHTLLALIGLALIFITFLMFKLVSTLTEEISLMAQHQLTTEQVLLYIKNFLLFVLFGSLQSFGLCGVIRSNRSILVAFISSLLVASVFNLIDHLFNSGSLPVALYLLIEAIFSLIHLLIIQSKRLRMSPNIHYIPMPDESCAMQTSISTSKYINI